MSSKEISLVEATAKGIGNLAKESLDISDKGILLIFVDKSGNGLRIKWAGETGKLTDFAFTPRGIRELTVPFNETDFQALSQGAKVEKAEPLVVVEWEGPYYPASMEDAEPLFRVVPGIGDGLYTANYDATTGLVNMVRTKKSKVTDVFDIPFVLNKPNDISRNADVLEATGTKWHR